jgi:hypothetical protein
MFFLPGSRFFSLISYFNYRIEKLIKKMKNRQNIFILTIVFILFRNAPSELIINELMINPNESGEWIELFNSETASINIRGYSISDGNDRCFLDSSHNLIIPAEGYLLIAQDSAALVSLFPWIECLILDPGGWPSLNNDGDVVVLQDKNRVTLDSVAYDIQEWFGSTLPKGISVERRTVKTGSNDPAGWSLSRNCNGATPGFRNSLPETVPEHFIVRAGPKLFHPQKGEQCVITAALPEQGELTVEFYNRQGRKVAGLFSGNAFEEKQLHWDGKDQKNQPVRPGPYILLVQLKGIGNEYRHKQSIIVAP